MVTHLFGQNAGAQNGAVETIIRGLEEARKNAFRGADGPVLAENVVAGKLAQALALTNFVSREEYPRLCLDHIIPAIEECYIMPASGYSAYRAAILMAQVARDLSLDDRKWVGQTPFAEAARFAEMEGLSEEQRSTIERWRNSFSPSGGAAPQTLLDDGPYMV
ncbi:MAG: hypothetical protein GC136_02765 [Alphaproteobacteria bacterium]|nr:hypothetical protein [Alphaproteobacteria bacterium]